MEQFLGPETDVKHQFLDPETDIKRQFLVDHPETDIMDQFLDPETDIMGAADLYGLELHFWGTLTAHPGISNFTSKEQ